MIAYPVIALAVTFIVSCFYTAPPPIYVLTAAFFGWLIGLCDEDLRR